MDEEGYFQIVDRKKDMIICGGFNVYPRDVEEVLFKHPAVQEAAVVGIPDEYRGETVKAFVVLKEGTSATEEEIIAFCREHLAKYKVPTSVEFRSELPKSTVGKVLRRELTESSDGGRMKQRYFIDSHKGFTFLVVLMLMAVYDQWQNPTAWVYLALHGTYGLLWVLKSRTLSRPAVGAAHGAGLRPGHLGRADAVLDRALAADLARGAGATLVPGAVHQPVRLWRLLSLCRGHAKAHGPQAAAGPDHRRAVSTVRNPNYFGELLIYLGFGLLAMHWAPLAVIAAVLVVVWFPTCAGRTAPWRAIRSLKNTRSGPSC